MILRMVLDRAVALPYKCLGTAFIPAVATGINENPSPIPLIEEIKVMVAAVVSIVNIDI